jgi:hypothetical protein
MQARFKPAVFSQLDPRSSVLATKKSVFYFILTTKAWCSLRQNNLIYGIFWVNLGHMKLLILLLARYLLQF